MGGCMPPACACGVDVENVEGLGFWATVTMGRDGALGVDVI